MKNRAAYMVGLNKMEIRETRSRTQGGRGSGED